MAKSRLEPNFILTIDTHNLSNIPLIVTDSAGDILYMCHSQKIFNSNFMTRQKLLEQVDKILEVYDIDTILLEQNKLFTDKISKFPDPLILRNIQLGFGVKISLEDKYYAAMKYIIELPQYDWSYKVLNSSVKYSIDLYKNHVEVMNRFTDEELETIHRFNYYKAICLSQSVLFDTLMHTKYQTNKGD